MGELADLERQLTLFDLPVCTYSVLPDGRFIEANLHLREMLGLPLEGRIEARTTDYYREPARRAEFLSQAIAAEATGKPPPKIVLELQVNGEALYVEDHCRPWRDKQGQIIGYIGCLVDITSEREAEHQAAELRQKIEDLTLDIGEVLHTHHNSLGMVSQTLDSVIALLSRKELDDLTPEQLDVYLVGRAAEVATTAERLLASGDEARRSQALSAAQWSRLRERVSFLQQVQRRVPLAELRLSAIRIAAHEARQLVETIRPGLLPRELTREVHGALTQLEQSAVLGMVTETRSTIAMVDHSLQTLREYITADVRGPVTREVMSLASLVDQAIKQQAEFARQSQIEVRVQDKAPDLQVRGNERDLVRTFANLLHNAIKYSWRRDQGRSPWVAVRINRDGAQAVVEVENWGVAIGREEIDEGLIFHVGYRGKWSADRGRRGTGIGLADALRVVQNHRGTLTVESAPAAGNSPSGARDYYQQPFVTKVTVRLPIQ